jgi:hypothetical protein
MAITVPLKVELIVKVSQASHDMFDTLHRLAAVWNAKRISPVPEFVEDVLKWLE